MTDPTGAQPLVRAVELDHIVLRTPDVERSLAFYCGLLGLAGEQVEEWRRGEAFFPSVRVNTGTIIDLLQAERTGENADHFCLGPPRVPQRPGTGDGARNPATPGSSGYGEVAIVQKGHDEAQNANPPHADHPAHFTCT